MRPRIAPYLERLRAVPFVRSVSAVKEQVQVGDVCVDALLVIKTPTGTERLYCEVKSSNLSRELAAQVASWGKAVKPLLVAAPVIGGGVGDFLAENDTNYVDLRGNCHIDLGGRYVAHVQGQRGERSARAKALRNPSYQVLFTVLAQPSLIGVPVRALAGAAGVSRQPVVTLRERLLELRPLIEITWSTCEVAVRSSTRLEMHAVAVPIGTSGPS